MKARLKRNASLGAFLSDQRGAVLPIMAVGMFVVIGAAVLAIDGSHVYMLQGKLQSAADAAALAAVRELPAMGQVQKTAQEYAAKNLVAKVHGNTLPKKDVVTGLWDKSSRTFTPGGKPANSVQVTLRRTKANGNPASTFFANFFGYDHMDIAVTAIAAYSTTKELDVVIVQDVTGSFKKELDEAKVADQVLLDRIGDYASGQSRVGLVAFTGFGTILEPQVGAPPLRTIDDAYSEMSAAIGSIQKCGSGAMPECSGTNIAAGMVAANVLFDGSPVGPYSAGQAMVVVSDGEPNARDAAQPYDGSCGGDCTNADLEAMAVQAADDAWAQGIDVYTVFFDDKNDDYAAAFLESLVRGEGKFFRTPDPTEMSILMFEICTENVGIGLVR